MVDFGNHLFGSDFNAGCTDAILKARDEYVARLRAAGIYA